MTMRLLATATILGLIATPALADCEDEVQNLRQTVTASTGTSEMPATPHQESVLPGAGPSGSSANPSSEPSTGGPANASTPHQEQVLDDAKTAADAGTEGSSHHPQDAAGGDVSGMLDQALSLAAAGDEQGCMGIVGEAERLLGAQ